jgi:hypothetical protein
MAYRHLCSKINHNSPNRARANTMLDISVLTKNRLWRIIGSSKLDLYRPLLPFHHTDATTAAIIADVTKLTQHLRVVVTSPGVTTTLIVIPLALQPPPPPPPLTPPPPKRRAVALPQPHSISEQAAAAHAIATHLTLHPTDTVVEETKTTEGMFGHKKVTVTFRRRTTQCRIANRVHRGNRSTVSVTLHTGLTSYGCYSPTCSNTYLNQPPASHQDNTPAPHPPPVTPSLEPPPPTDTPPPGGGRPPD